MSTPSATTIAPVAAPGPSALDQTIVSTALPMIVGDLGGAGRTELPAVREAAGSALGISDGWCVGQIRIRRYLDLPPTLANVAARTRVPAEVLRPAFDAAI